MNKTTLLSSDNRLLASVQVGKPVEIVHFPEMQVACLEHLASASTLAESQKRFIQWRKANGLSPSPAHRTYICYFKDSRSAPTEPMAIDLCVSIEAPVVAAEGVAAEGILIKSISSGRYARARHVGSREEITTADWLYHTWLTASGEEHDKGRPLVLHFVNLGHELNSEQQITDVYLPLL